MCPAATVPQPHAGAGALCPTMRAMRLTAFASLLTMAAAGGSYCKDWIFDTDDWEYTKRDRSASGPGKAIDDTPCLFGQDEAEGECVSSGKNEGPAGNVCTCISKEAAHEAASTHQAIMLGVGGGLVGFGIILAIACWGFAGPIEDCCREMNDRWPSQPVEPKAQRRLIPLCASSAFTVIRARPSGTDAAP